MFGKIRGEDVVLKVIERSDYGIIIQVCPGDLFFRIESCVGIDCEENCEKC